MKNFNLLLIILLTSIITTVKMGAQTITIGDDYREKLAIGVKAGINISSLTDKKGETFDFDSKVRIAAGAFMSVPIGKYFGFQPEVMYSQKGFKGKGSFLGFPYEYKRRTSYIDVPLLLQIKPVHHLTLLVGPQYSFLLHKSIKFTSNPGGVEVSDNVRSNVRQDMVGVVAGLDIKYFPVVLSGRIAWDLLNNEGDGTLTSPRYRYMVVQVTAGIFF